eukprot:SAG22_NODE_12190_length_450_cov_0.864407_1_plen_83_part_00
MPAPPAPAPALAAPPAPDIAAQPAVFITAESFVIECCESRSMSIAASMPVRSLCLSGVTVCHASRSLARSLAVVVCLWEGEK